MRHEQYRPLTKLVPFPIRNHSPLALQPAAVGMYCSFHGVVCHAWRLRHPISQVYMQRDGDVSLFDTLCVLLVGVSAGEREEVRGSGLTCVSEGCRISSLLHPRSRIAPTSSKYVAFVLLFTPNSKVLGTCVLLGGLAFKLPQILKLQKNKSAAGVSVFSAVIYASSSTWLIKALLEPPNLQSPPVQSPVPDHASSPDLHSCLLTDRDVCAGALCLGSFDLLQLPHPSPLQVIMAPAFSSPAAVSVLKRTRLICIHTCTSTYTQQHVCVHTNPHIHSRTSTYGMPVQ